MGLYSRQNDRKSSGIKQHHTEGGCRCNEGKNFFVLFRKSDSFCKHLKNKIYNLNKNSAKFLRKNLY